MAKILIVTGSTSIPLDGVRKLTNFASGKTGISIAREALKRGHEVTLLTSTSSNSPSTANWNEIQFDTYDDLKNLLHGQVAGGNLHAVVMAAAISDYGNPSFHESCGGQALNLPAASKFPSDWDEVWLRLRKLPKIIDLIRSPWGFKGLLVKFKLEANITENELTKVAEASRLHSQANLIVANRLEDFKQRAWVGPIESGFIQTSRQQLPAFLLDTMQPLLEK